MAGDGAVTDSSDGAVAVAPPAASAVSTMFAFPPAATAPPNATPGCFSKESTAPAVVCTVFVCVALMTAERFLFC